MIFDYTTLGEKVGLVEEVVGKSGWLQVSKLTISALEDEDRLLLAGVCDDGARIASGHL